MRTLLHAFQEIVKCTGRTRRTFKNMGWNCSGFMNSVYDRTVKGCNTRDIREHIGPTFTVAFVIVTQGNIRDFYRIPVKRYKVVAKFTQRSRRFVCSILWAIKLKVMYVISRLFLLVTTKGNTLVYYLCQRKVTFVTIMNYVFNYAVMYLNLISYCFNIQSTLTADIFEYN